MGYETRLHLVGITIRDECRAAVKRQIRSHKRIADETLQLFLDWAAIDSEGALCFRADEDDTDGDAPDEEGLVPTKDAKWYGAEVIVDWVKPYCEGGMIVFHSQEADGCAWGWEFDGQGKTRFLELRPKGKWA